MGPGPSYGGTYPNRSRSRRQTVGDAAMAGLAITATGDHDMNRFFELLWRPIVPVAVVAGSCLLLMLLALGIVQGIEAAADNPGPFDLHIRPLGDASFVVLACAGMFICIGIATARWSFLLIANVAFRRDDRAYGVNWAFPLGHLLATGLIFTGTAVVLFYAIRATAMS